MASVKKQPKRRHSYHTFVRYKEPNLPPQKIKALMKAGTGIVTIRLTEEHIRKAMKQDGFADSQNCAGAVCVIAHAKHFSHSVVGTIDWWRNRVIILSQEYTGKNEPICYAYAHYDNTEILFDGTISDLQKLLKNVQKSSDGYVDITLYPVKRGKHSKTGKPTRPVGVNAPHPAGRGGSRKIGSDKRWENFVRARPITAARISA